MGTFLLVIGGLFQVAGFAFSAICLLLAALSQHTFPLWGIALGLMLIALGRFSSNLGRKRIQRLDSERFREKSRAVFAERDRLSRLYSEAEHPTASELLPHSKFRALS